MKATLFSVLTLVGVSLFPGAAEAQNCAVHYAAAFARISGSVPKAVTQTAADQEVDAALGPRPQPVSYTHLDVYKRQVYDGRRMASLRNPTRLPPNDKNGSLRILN